MTNLICCWSITKIKSYCSSCDHRLLNDLHFVSQGLMSAQQNVSEVTANTTELLEDVTYMIRIL